MTCALQERRRNFQTGEDFASMLRGIAEAAYCGGLALAAVTLVLALQSFFVFQWQVAAFTFVPPNEQLQRLRATAISATAMLAYAVLDMLHRQAVQTDIALIDWERPQQVRSGSQTLCATHA